MGLLSALAVPLSLAASTSPDRWGDYPTWVAGIGTVGAVVVALVLAGRDGRRRDREARRSQAELQTAWMRFPPQPSDPADYKQVVTVSILNGSNQLAYKVIASLVPVRGTAPPNFREMRGDLPTAFRVFVGELPPGQHDFEVAYPGGGGFIRFAVELAFKDAAGRKWVRGVEGNLREIKAEPADHYDLPEPLDWYLFEQ